MNGILLLITAGLGLAGGVLSLLPIPTVRDYWISPSSIAVIGVVGRLYAAGALENGSFLAVCMVIAAAFLISIVLYVAYYRMEEMKAFYAAMVPLVTEAVTMGVLVGIVIAGK